MKIFASLHGVDLIVDLANVVEKVVDLRDNRLVKPGVASEEVDDVDKSID